VNVTSFLETNLFTGVAPGGTVTFFDGATQMTGTLTLTPRPGITGLDASVSATLTATFTSPGSHLVSARYSGDPSYAASTSTANPTSVFWPTTLTVTPSSSTINFGQSVTLTATAMTTGKHPVMTGTFGVSTGQTLTPKLSVDGSGNQTLSATFTTTPQFSGLVGVGYSGDSNYNGSSGADNVTVIVPDFSMTANPTSLTLAAGQTQTSSVSIAPASAMSSTVALSCSAASFFGVACDMSPVSVKLANNAAASSTVTLTPGGATTTNGAKATVKKRKAFLPINFEKQSWTLTGIVVVLLLLTVPLHRRRKHLASASAALCAVLILVIGCGGGSSSSGGTGSGGDAGGGGGSAEQVATSVTISLANNKIGQNPNGGTTAKATATVTSTKALTGTVTFWALNGDSALTPPIPITNGKVTADILVAQVGFYQVYAQYSGDANNKMSQSAPLLQEVIGNGFANVMATTGPLTHYLTIPVTVQ
jgi:large repetitive protein